MTVSAKKLVTDCRIVMHDMQEVLRARTGQAMQHIENLRERRRRCENPKEEPALTEFTAEFVHDTWARVALAVAIGLLVGLMLRPIVKGMV